MFYPVVVKKVESNWLSLLVKNKIKALSIKRDIRHLKRHGQNIVFNWMQMTYLPTTKDFISVAWMLPKKYIPRAVDRNRLKRWGRENLRNNILDRGCFLFRFSFKAKDFYKKLNRKDFDYVFKNTLGQISKNH